MKKWMVLDKLADIVLSHVSGCVIDIGIGFSTKVLHAHSSKLRRFHYCCDTLTERCNWAKTLGHIKVFEGKSIDFLKQFSDNLIALAFIDGDHHYSTVIQEVNLILPKLTLGGVIFLHDTLPRDWKDVYGCTESNRFTGDVYLARQDLEQRWDLQVFTWPYAANNVGLTMIMQKEKNPPVFRA